MFPPVSRVFQPLRRTLCSAVPIETGSMAYPFCQRQGGTHACCHSSALALNETVASMSIYIYICICIYIYMAMSQNPVPSEHPNPHTRLFWVVHLPQNGTIGVDPPPHVYVQLHPSLSTAIHHHYPGVFYWGPPQNGEW